MSSINTHYLQHVNYFPAVNQAVNEDSLGRGYLNSTGSLTHTFSLLDELNWGLFPDTPAAIDSAGSAHLGLEADKKETLDATEVSDAWGYSPEELQKQIKALIGGGIAVANIATSLGLVDNAVSLLKKAYGNVRYFLDHILKLLGNQKPSGDLQSLIGFLEGQRDQVLAGLQKTLSSNGGVQLSMEEAEALLLGDNDFDGQKPAQAQKILQNFNLNKTKADLKKNTTSAVDKLMQKLPDLLTQVSETLLHLQQNPEAGSGSAHMFLNAALTKLELASGMLSILSGGENVFKAQAVKSASVDRFKSQIDKLNQQVDQLWVELESRGIVRSRTPELPNAPTLEELKLAEKASSVLKERKLQQKSVSNKNLPQNSFTGKENLANISRQNFNKPVSFPELHVSTQPTGNDLGPV